jgi:hypothetical protein
MYQQSGLSSTWLGCFTNTTNELVARQAKELQQKKTYLEEEKEAYSSVTQTRAYSHAHS